METKLQSQGLSEESKNWLKGYFDGLYAASGHNHSGVYSLVDHNHSSVYSPVDHQHGSIQVVYHHLNSATVPAGSTSYIIPSIPGFTYLNGLVWPVAGTFWNMVVRLNGGQPASGSLVVTVQKNVADTDCVTTVPAGAATLTNWYSSQPAAFAAGDLLTIKVKNNATAASGGVTSWSVLFQSSTY